MVLMGFGVSPHTAYAPQGRRPGCRRTQDQLPAATAPFTAGSETQHFTATCKVRCR